MKRKAVIFGIKGTKLTSEERSFLKDIKPWGIILFSRNIKNFNQVKSLTTEIKYTLKDKNYPIIIDEEGGRVSRLGKILNLGFFSQSLFGKLYELDKKNFYNYYEVYISKVCSTLRKLRININTVPVLDVRRQNSHDIIGSRSYSNDPEIVSKIGQICINLFKKYKIATVTKHIPGHGLSKKDSHYHLPVVKEKKAILTKNDFKPFKKCKSFFSMTAHIVYSSYDPVFPATHSKVVIKKVIRKHIGFKGILISDDISMKALNYNLKENATRALEAGCNLILHCNGNIKEMKKLANIVPPIDMFTKKKTSLFYKFLG